MKTKTFWVIMGIVVSMTFPVRIYSQRGTDADSWILRAVRTDTPPVMDGKLDDPCWKRADVATDFRQRRPHEGEPAEEQTEVRILYDDTNLYISFRCFDAHPERIISRLLPRDGIAYPNDNVDFIIDTYHDHRNAYYFQVNAKGVKHDSWQRDSNWDGVWWCQTAMDDAGWSAEIGIPFKTLRFSHQKVQTWGMNFSRQRQAGNERSQWANARREFSVTTVYKAGDVVGFENLDPGVHLEILPYVTGRREQTTEDIERRFDGGANLKYGIAPNLTYDMTVNPDFAHVEADEEQINLSRFELYLKEKRPYFLENRKVFDTPIRLFYTRRIADPDFGMRLTGKIAGNDIALLQAVDRVEGSPNPNYTVFRLRREILRKSNIGLFSVNKDWNGGYARALGMDTHLALGEQFEIDAQWAKSFNPDIHHDDWAGLLNVWKGTRNFEVYAEAEKTGPEFNVDQIGYAPHDPHIGTRSGGMWLQMRGRREKYGIEWLWLGQWMDARKDSDDEDWEWSWNPEIGVRFFNGTSFSLGVQRQDFIYAQKEYNVRKWWLRHNFRSNRIHWLSGSLYAATGDQMDWADGYFGAIRQMRLNTTLTPLDRLTIDMSLDNVWEYDPDDRFDEFKQVGYVRTTFLFSRELFCRVFVQGNRNTDQYAVNMLLSYEYRPNSRLYLAYNERRDDSAGDMKVTNRIFFVKLAYLWNL